MLTIQPALLKTPFVEKFILFVIHYKRGTGAKLNLSKTEAMWLGA